MENVNEGDKPLNPFDPAKLRLSERFGASTGVKKLLMQVPVSKPGKQDWFRVHPDASYRFDMGIIEFEEDGEMYIVTPDLHDALADEVKPVTLYTAVTRQGGLFLWWVRLPGEDGQMNPAWESSHATAELAIETWTRRQWNAAINAYDIYQASGITTEPNWPDVSFDVLLELAFKNRLIDRPDHPVILKLRGEA